MRGKPQKKKSGNNSWENLAVKKKAKTEGGGVRVREGGRVGRGREGGLGGRKGGRMGWEGGRNVSLRSLLTRSLLTLS
jgi:hypothetical protein